MASHPGHVMAAGLPQIWHSCCIAVALHATWMCRESVTIQAIRTQYMRFYLKVVHQGAKLNRLLGSCTRGATLALDALVQACMTTSTPADEGLRVFRHLLCTALSSLCFVTLQACAVLAARGDLAMHVKILCSGSCCLLAFLHCSTAPERINA